MNIQKPGRNKKIIFLGFTKGKTFTIFTDVKTKNTKNFLYII